MDGNEIKPPASQGTVPPLAAGNTESGGHWVTIHGSPVLIREGETVSEALEKRDKTESKSSQKPGEKSKLKVQNESEKPSGNQIESAADHVGGSSRTTPGHDEDWKTRERRHAAEEGRLEAWAKDNGKLGGKAIKPEDRGSEHHVAFDPKSNC